MAFVELREEGNWTTRGDVAANLEGIPVSRPMVKWIGGVSIECFLGVEGIVQKLLEPVKSCRVFVRRRSTRTAQVFASTSTSSAKQAFRPMGAVVLAWTEYLPGTLSYLAFMWRRITHGRQSGFCDELIPCVVRERGLVASVCRLIHNGVFVKPRITGC